MAQLGRDRAIELDGIVADCLAAPMLADRFRTAGASAPDREKAYRIGRSDDIASAGQLRWIG